MLTEQQLTKIDGLQRKALVVGVAGCLLAIVGGGVYAAFSPLGVDKIFQPFLAAWVLWLALGIGPLTLVMVHHLCGGGWSFVCQRIAEAGSRTLPFFFVTGIIIVLGGLYFSDVYPWTDPAFLKEHHVVAEKTPFLNKTVFTAGFLVYFGVWLLFMALYNRWSQRLDETGDQNIIGKMRFWAGPGLVLYVVTITVAATHWVMSLEPQWFSTIYGAWLIAGYSLTTIAFCVVVLSYLMDQPPIEEKVSVRNFHHLGNFLLGFTIFWTYIGFSQYLLIWSANLPEEISFYLHRTGTALIVLTVIMCVVHWFLPMMTLLIRKTKTNVATLRKIALWLLAARVLDIYWNIVPSFPDNHSRIDIFTLLLVLAAIVGFGGVWLWFFLQELKKRPLLPVHDPREKLLFLRDAHSHA